jgi:hypothetical protein
MFQRMGQLNQVFYLKLYLFDLRFNIVPYNAQNYHKILSMGMLNFNDFLRSLVFQLHSAIIQN